MELRAVLALIVSLSVVSGKVISCTSSGTVQVGDSATVTCNYHSNLRKEKTGFYVYRYQDNMKDPDVPVMCDWEAESLSCDIMPGYQVQLLDERVTLNISSAQQALAGRFVCKTFQSEDGVRVEDCKLNVTIKGSIVKLPQNRSIYCHAEKGSLQKQPKSIMCFVPNTLNARSIILERHDFYGTSKIEEIASCNRETESCTLNMDGYKITRSHDEDYSIIIVMVAKAGTYFCKIEGEVSQTKTCSVSFDAAPIEVPVCADNSKDQFGIVDGAVIGLVFTNVVSIVYICILRWRSRKSQQETSSPEPNANNTNVEHDNPETIITLLGTDNSTAVS